MRLPARLEVLRERDFRLVFGAQVVSLFGDEALSAMSPPAGRMGRLVSADLTEVKLDREPSAR